jgi:hypothetical protein
MANLSSGSGRASLPIRPRRLAVTTRSRARGRASGSGAHVWEPGKPSHDWAKRWLSGDLFLYTRRVRIGRRREAPTALRGRQADDENVYPERTRTHNTWRFTRAGGDAIEAVPGGPYQVARGDKVRLDGGRSRSSVGKIRWYRWRYALGRDCPDGLRGVSPVKASTARVTFTALCSFSAHLTVRDTKGECRHAVDVRCRHAACVDYPYFISGGRASTPRRFSVVRRAHAARSLASWRESLWEWEGVAHILP